MSANADAGAGENGRPDPQRTIVRALRGASMPMTTSEIRETDPPGRQVSASALRDNLKLLAHLGYVERGIGLGPRNSDVWSLTQDGMRLRR